MEDPNRTVDVRQPPWAKAAYAVSVLVGAAFLVMVFAFDPPPLAAAAFSMVAIGICVYNVASVTSWATAAALGPLRVRNRFSTAAIERADVEKVFVRTGFSSLNRVELLCRDGSVVPLVACEMPPLPRTRRRLEAQAAEVRAWLDKGVSR